MGRLDIQSRKFSIYKMIFISTRKSIFGILIKLLAPDPSYYWCVKIERWLFVNDCCTSTGQEEQSNNTA